MYGRILENEFSFNQSAFLLGPRQCGKTTILKKLDSLLYIDLLVSEEFLKYNRKPSSLYLETQALPKKSGVIVIDEIQKVPQLLNEVQRCIDQFPDLSFILSGSSARKLKRGGANLLGGRAANLSLYPLSMLELEDDFDIETMISFGSLPKVWTLLSSGKKRQALMILRSYVTTYLTEEIKAEALVRNLENFQRFLEVAAHQFGREVNQSELGDQASIATSSVKNYYDILEDTLIGFYLYPYSTSVRKELTKTPKFYFFDNGVTRAIQGDLSSQATNQSKGYLFEQLMIQEIMKLNSYYQMDLKFNFWRTVGGAEVDLVISQGGRLLVGIEFKSSPFPRSRDLSGLRSFSEEYPMVPVIMCAPLDRPSMIDNQVKVLGSKDLLRFVLELARN